MRRKIYKESLIELLPLILLSVIILEAYIFTIYYKLNSPFYDEISYDYETGLYILFHILLVMFGIFTFYELSFLNSRIKSDFYHSLGISKLSLVTTKLLAVLTYTIILIPVSYFMYYKLLRQIKTIVFWWDDSIFIPWIITSLGLFFILLGAILICTCFSGNVFITVPLSVIMFFFPLYSYFALDSQLHYNTPSIIAIDTYVPLLLGQGTFLYIKEYLLGIVMIAIGLYLHKKRPSEVAKKKLASLAYAQGLVTILVSGAGFLLFIFLFNDNKIDSSILRILIGIVVVYAILEIIILYKKGSKTLFIASIPIIIACSLTSFFTIKLISNSVKNYKLDKDKIEAITLYDASAYDYNYDPTELDKILIKTNINSEEARDIVYNSFNRTINNPESRTIAVWVTISGKKLEFSIALNDEEYDQLKRITYSTPSVYEWLENVPSHDNLYSILSIYNHNAIHDEAFNQKVYESAMAEYKALKIEDKREAIFFSGAYTFNENPAILQIKYAEYDGLRFPINEKYFPKTLKMIIEYSEKNTEK